MTTGCEKCDDVQRRTGSKSAICDTCELEYLESEFERARSAYMRKLREINDKEKKDE